MPTFKVHKRNDFTCIANKLLRDKDLSNQAIGLMCKMLSLPPDWNYSIKGLVAICKDGQCKITSALQELKDNGYLAIIPIRENGRITKWEYHIYEDKNLSLKDDSTIEDTCNDIVEQSDNDSDIKSNDSDKVIVESEPAKETKKTTTKNSTTKTTTKKISKTAVYQKEAESIIDYLNLRTNKRFSYVNGNIIGIRNLFKRGYTVEDLRAVIDLKIKEWSTDTMWKYVRPTTLFGDKFEGYLDESRHPSANTFNQYSHSNTFKTNTQTNNDNTVPWATDYYTQKRPTEFGTVFA